MNGIFGLLYLMLIKMNILLLVIWGLFHYTLVGINMELYVASELKALEGYVQNSTVSSRTLYDE
jgi:hypothetical protein